MVEKVKVIRQKTGCAGYLQELISRLESISARLRPCKHLCTMLFLALVVCLGGATTFAEEISLEQAETAVGNWIAKGGGFGKMSGGARVSGETLEDPDTGAKMHLVRVPGKGFVVTSADDGIEPIVLFSDGKGVDLVAEEGNPVWDLLRWDLAARAAALKDEEDNGGSRLRLKSASGTGIGEQGKVSPKEKWASLLPEKNSAGSPRLKALSPNMQSCEIRVDQFIHTTWGQSNVGGQPAYNYYTPGKIKIVGAEVQNTNLKYHTSGESSNVETNEVGHYPCGCVATAGAQLMKKWKYPSSPKSRKTETCKRDGEDLVLTMKGGSYDWTGMGGERPLKDSQREAVGRVTFDIGVACKASYGEKVTSMSTATLVEKLRTVFGYRSADWYSGKWHLSSTIVDELKRIVIPNFEARAPILLAIQRSRLDNTINHCVVADGYGYDGGELIIHVNFGWSGSSNAWYAPPDLNAGGEFNYGFIMGIGYNISPDGAGTFVSGRATGANGRALAGATVELCSTSGSVLSTTKTEKNGSYWFQQEPGDYKVRISLGGETDSSLITLAECDEETIGNELKDWTITSAPSVSDVSVVTSSTKSGAKGNAGSSIISSPISVRLSCATVNAEIHYTLDGTQPIPESPVFDGAITIQDTTTLRAVAYADGMECSETFEQTWMFVDPVSRDNFANARPIDGTSGHASFNNTGYTKESGEPIHSKDGTSGGTSAWAVWTAPESGDWTFHLSGVITNINEDMDTQLAVYTGTSVDALTRVVANDDVNAAEGDYSSRVSFSATKGTHYYIAMDSYRGTSYPGTLALRWEEGFVHYAQFDHSSLFLPSSGGHVEIGVESSVAWSLVECSDWITPRAATGESGRAFVFDAMPNTTGSERSGYVTIQADNSEFATLSIRQHVMDFVTTKEEAVEVAWRENKRILLVRGRETCGNTSSTLFYSVPSSTVRSLVEAGYVLWYSNCDRQTDASGYTSGLGSYTLPLVCILDPKDMSTYVARTTGYQSASALKSFLEASATWSGLASPTKVEMSGVGAALSSTPYSMSVTFADGTCLNLKHGVTWSIASGSSATISDEGVLTPVSGRTGTVTIRGSVTLRGQVYSRTMDVRIIDPAKVTGVTISGPDVIDLYDVDNGHFTATVTCSDGTKAIVAPKWSIKETTITNAVISADGFVTFPNPEKYNKASRLRVTAECNGISASKEADVWGWSVSLSSWTTPQRVVWPGQTVKIVPKTVTWWRHGVTEAPTTDFNGVDFSISYGYVNGNTYVGPNNATSAADGPALQIPSSTSEAEGYCYVYVRTSATRLGHVVAKGLWPYFKYLPSSPAQTVNVTFIADGGQPATQTSKYAVGYTYGYLPDVARTGYYCYWYTAAEGGTQIITASNCLSSVTRLYAHWSPRYYYVTYNANGGEGSMSSSWFYYDRPANLRANTFTKVGADFAGWATSPDGPVVYHDREEILNLSSVYAEITLYARWTPDVGTYTVRYRRYDGSGETAEEQFKCGKTYSLAWLGSMLGWMREDYEFCGWVPWNPDTKPRLCKYANGQPVKDLAAAGETIELYCGWKSASSYRVCFHRCAGPDDLTKMNQVILRNKEDSLAWMDSMIGWKRDGYTFAGWDESEKATAVKYANGAKVKNLAMDGGTKHLYAVWRAKDDHKYPYTVKFYRYDGSGETRTQSFNAGTVQSLLWFESQLGWKRDGYEFCGWVPWNPDTKARLCKYTNGQKVVDLASKSGETVNLYAAWKSASSYRVCFHKNDGTDVKMNQVILRNKEDSLAWMDSQIGWKRDGYVLKGWAETEKGAVKYANGAKVKNLAMDGGTKHLYAVWRVAD